MKKYFSIVAVFFVTLAFAQTKSEVTKITSHYNFKKLDLLKQQFQATFNIEKNKAIKTALINNWPLTKFENGNYMELQKISDLGKPIYYTTNNLAAAKSTRAIFLYDNGGLNINVEGQNMNAFVWDGSAVRTSHQEFMDNGSSKVTIADGTTQTSLHSTHVMGTMISQGVNANARGMAFRANGYSLDWNNDAAEVASAVGFGMLVSNHSYGPNFDAVSPWYFGAYSADSRSWDQIMYEAPYYLLCVAAGNDGSETNTSALDGYSSYDKLTTMSTSKNSMAVANAYDAILDNTTGEIIGGASIHSSSSQGPTDDYRIKPDITGNGYNLYSCTDVSDNSYEYATGTSMASPNVAGTLLLLQQLYNQEKGNFMLAATLKGLALHTADDRGLNGPDAVYGWGYLNAKKAAEVILSNVSLISENTLNDGDSYSFDVVSSGSEPLEISISWTDSPGTANNGDLNDTTPVLVNDLDIRVTKDNTTYYPWKLTGVTTNSKGDNIVDPFEKVEIINPGNNTYHVTVSHKGTLFNNIQNYSIVATGITSFAASLNQNRISDFIIFPNPSTDKHINISITESLYDGVLVVYDLMGNVVKREMLSSENIQNIDLSNLDNGIYLLSLSNQGVTKTKKLIIK